MLSTGRMVWWIAPLQIVALFAAPMVVFAYAGGTGGQVSAWFNAAVAAPTGKQTLALLADPPTPFGLALLTVVAMLIADGLADVAGRRSERRNFHRWHAARYPEHVPPADDPDSTAELAGRPGEEVVAR